MRKFDKLTWFKDGNRHIIESKNKRHRLLYCPLCRELILKSECQKLRQDKRGNMYEVKRYHYDKSSKIERAERKEEKEVKRLQELPSIELGKVVNTFFSIH